MTDTHTHRETLHDGIYRAYAYAPRGKKKCKCTVCQQWVSYTNSLCMSLLLFIWQSCSQRTAETVVCSLVAAAALLLDASGWFTRRVAKTRTRLCLDARLDVAFHSTSLINGYVDLASILSLTHILTHYIVTVSVYQTAHVTLVSRLNTDSFNESYNNKVTEETTKWKWVWLFTPCLHKKGATDFFTITFTNIYRFLGFLVHNFANEY